MQNLLEKLQPEFLQKLDEEAKTYPNTIEDLKKTLAKYYFVTEVPLGYICQLCSHLNIDVKLLEIFNLFQYKQNDN